MIRSELSKYYKIRATTKKEEKADVIFPKTKLAFMITNIKDVPKSEHDGSIKDMAEFSASFQRSFVMVISSGQDHLLQNISQFQINLQQFNNYPEVLLCVDAVSCVSCMVELSKVDERSHITEAKEQEQLALLSSVDYIGTSVLKTIPGLSDHHADVLLQGMGSISNIIVTNCANKIRDKTSLDLKTATSVKNFFHQ
ncbi:Na(+)-translocating NADH-quinone reductase subunit E [Acrasis kona]|uniref:Na(+)-translocating NADH-quinone reductase subunit E n=1 Tax=Acrasis kona TaxID=1008807 RepID=A0AAW2Z357_9EUKA